MWITITTALITSLISPILIKIVDKRLEQRSYPKHPPGRSQRLLGVWKGIFEQDDPHDHTKKLPIELEMHYHNEGRIFKGIGIFHTPYDNMDVIVELKNGMFDGNILKIDYQNKNKYVFQKGTTVLRMNPEGRGMEGKFLGYSPNIDKIIHGTIHVEKII